MFWQKLSIGSVLLVGLAACASLQDQQAMERDLGEMKRRLADAERTVATLQQETEGALKAQRAQASDRLETVARNTAENQAELDRLRVEMQSFAGRFDDMARSRKEARDELALMRDDLALKITAIEDRLAKLETAPKTPAPAPVETPEALYERGLELIQQRGEFAKGREALQEFLRRSPQSPLAVNAQYWIGESFYGEKKYENAILQYQEVIERYKEHPKVAAALLKQGYAFAAIGDQKNARVVLQRLTETFPLSEEARKGKERLQEWSRETGKK